MKNKLFKLFLVLGVIIFALFAFASCEENKEEKEPKAYLGEITDSEYIEFVLKNFDVGTIYEPPYFYSLGLFRLYKTSIEHEDIEFKEYITSGSTKVIAGYLPRESIELIFNTDADAYLKNVNELSMHQMLYYLENNNLKYNDVGFKLYYVNEKRVAPSFDNEFIVYMGEEGFASDNDGNTIKIIGDIENFQVNENLKVEYENIENRFFTKSTRYFWSALSVKFLTSFGGCKIYNENGVDVLKEDEYYLQQAVLGEEFINEFASAELNIETKLNTKGEPYIINRVYDYEKIKEIFSIKKGG